jgi:RNA polymerase sigma-70 factor (ECF subfamily)
VRAVYVSAKAGVVVSGADRFYGQLCKMSDLPAIVAEIPRLRRYARALTGDAERADDLVQDTLERALAKWSLWRHGSNLRAWLFTIMHNAFINQVRAPQAVDYRAEENMPEAVQRATQSDGLELRDLDRALGHLPLDQREVLLLVALEDLSYAQTATVLGVPIGTVMSRLARGRARLRTVLAGETATMLKVIK